MSLTEFVWLLALVAGVALGVWLPSPRWALLLGFALWVASIVLFAYSFEYPEAACNAGEECPTGLHVVEIANPPLLALSVPLFVVGIVRRLRETWSDLRRAATTPPLDESHEEQRDDTRR